VAEVQRHLKDYVQNELFRGDQPPSPSRRRYYPTTEDIRNILNTKRTGARKATDDQENLDIYCEKWREENINDSIYYRVKYKKIVVPVITTGQLTDYQQYTIHK
jgi:hypothetical protein